MRRLLMTMLVAMTVAIGAKAIGFEDARREARYLTDKMAYELGLSQSEYERIYRINLDYLTRVNGYDDLYATHWNARNSALQVVLTGRRWNAYIGRNYFYRPLSWRNGTFVYNVYSRYPRHYVVHRAAPLPPPRIYRYRGPGYERRGHGYHRHYGHRRR